LILTININNFFLKKKELKKQLQFYKEREKWEQEQSAVLDKQKAEEARLAALPAWKREQLMKKGAISPPATNNPPPTTNNPPPPTNRFVIFFKKN